MSKFADDVKRMQEQRSQLEREGLDHLVQEQRDRDLAKDLRIPRGWKTSWEVEESAPKHDPNLLTLVKWNKAGSAIVERKTVNRAEVVIQDGKLISEVVR